MELGGGIPFLVYISFILFILPLEPTILLVTWVLEGRLITFWRCIPTTVLEYHFHHHSDTDTSTFPVLHSPFILGGLHSGAGSSFSTGVLIHVILPFVVTVILHSNRFVIRYSFIHSDTIFDGMMGETIHSFYSMGGCSQMHSLEEFILFILFVGGISRYISTIFSRPILFILQVWYLMHYRMGGVFRVLFPVVHFHSDHSIYRYVTYLFHFSPPRLPLPTFRPFHSSSLILEVYIYVLILGPFWMHSFIRSTIHYHHSTTTTWVMEDSVRATILPPSFLGIHSRFVVPPIDGYSIPFHFTDGKEVLPFHHHRLPFDGPTIF